MGYRYSMDAVEIFIDIQEPANGGKASIIFAVASKNRLKDLFTRPLFL